MLTRRCQKMSPEKAMITPAPGAEEVILPVNLREISALCGDALAATGAGGRQRITRGK